MRSQTRESTAAATATRATSHAADPSLLGKSRASQSKGPGRQRRKRRGDGRVVLGGTRIRKIGGRRMTQRGRQDKLLNKKRTAVSVAEGVAEITCTTQRKMPALRKKRKHT